MFKDNLSSEYVVLMMLKYSYLSHKNDLWFHDAETTNHS